MKLGKNKQKKILDGFSTQPWTDFQLKNPQILDGFSTLQHIYICCKLRIRNWSKIWGVLKLKTGPSFSLFSPFLQCFGYVYKHKQCHIVPKQYFCKILGMSKMRFSKRKLHFFCLFYVGEIEPEKINKLNGKGQKKTL